MTNLTPTLILESDDAYRLSDTTTALWLTVDNLSLHLRRVERGLLISVYPHGQEDESPITTLFANYGDASALQHRRRQHDSDAIRARARRLNRP